MDSMNIPLPFAYLVIIRTSTAFKGHRVESPAAEAGWHRNKGLPSTYHVLGIYTAPIFSRVFPLSDRDSALERERASPTPDIGYKWPEVHVQEGRQRQRNARHLQPFQPLRRMISGLILFFPFL